MPIRRTKSTRKTRNSKKRGNKNYRTRRNTRRYNKVKRVGGDEEYDKCLEDTKNSFKNTDQNEIPSQEYIEDFCKKEEEARNKPKRKVVNRPKIN